MNRGIVNIDWATKPLADDEWNDLLTRWEQHKASGEHVSKIVEGSAADRWAKHAASKISAEVSDLQDDAYGRVRRSLGLAGAAVSDNPGLYARYRDELWIESLTS